MRKVFLDDLPRWKKGEGKGRPNTINWSESIGFKVSFVYDDIEGEIEIIDYDVSNGKLKISYKNDFFVIDAACIYNGKIAKIFKLRTSNFKVEIGHIFKDDKRDLIITDREYRENKNGKSLKWYKYKCNKCNNEKWIVESNLLKLNQGCSFCCHNAPAMLGFNTIWDTDRWMVDLGVSEEDAKTHRKGSSKKIRVICPDCGKEKNIVVYSLYTRKSIGCTCGDGQSYISKYVRSLLDQLNVDYETEVKHEWNRYINPKNNKLTQARIDFIVYKDGRVIPIEADGAWHRKDNSMSGITAKFQQCIDKQRDENCLKYLGEETIRISDEGDIRENILNSKLNDIFDLTNINWNKCEKFALSNLVKEVCDCWNNKEEWETTIDIANKIKCSSVTIVKYLKKGTRLEMCNYNAKEEYKKTLFKKGIRPNNSRYVEIFKDSISLGVFDSCAELERRSEDLFGVKLSKSRISEAGLGNIDIYKGFTFKYIDNKISQKVV